MRNSTRNIRTKNSSRLNSPGQCYVCGRYGGTHVHHIFNGYGLRMRSDEDGLFCHVCFRCHEESHRNADLRLKLKQMGQQIYEEQIGSHEQFMERYRKNYL